MPQISDAWRPIIAGVTPTGASPAVATLTQTFSTADATHAARAAAALTDNSGGAAADGTIGAVTAPTALTDNGGGTADNTVASMAEPAALTVTDGAGTNDGTIGAITADASVIAAVQELAAKIGEFRTWAGVVKDNFKELTTAQAANRAAIVALTDAVKELSTGVNNVRTDAVDTASFLNSLVDNLQTLKVIA